MKRLLPGLVITLVIVAACGGDDGGDVEGVEWGLVELPGSEIPDVVEATLLLDEGTASGNSGCNTFTGSYELDGSDLSFGDLAGTRMACVPEVDEFEVAFLAALGQASTAQVVDDELVLSSGDDTLMVFQASD